MTTPDLLIYIAVGAALFGAGYAVGRWERRANLDLPRRQRLHLIGRVAVGLLIIGLVVATQIQASQQAARLRAEADADAAQTACLQGYYTAVSSNLAATSQARAEETSAQRRLLQAQTGAMDDAQEAFVEYLAALDRLEAARAANPIPGPPSC